VDGDDPPPIDTPGYLVLVLAGRDACVALDAALCVAEELHARHGSGPPDLAERRLRLLHLSDDVIAVGRCGVCSFAKDIRITSRRILRSQVLALEVAGEMERHEGNALADPLGHHRHDADLAFLRTLDPDHLAVLDAEIVRISRMNLDKHILLELREPWIGPALVAAALVLDEASGRQNDRVLLGYVP